MKKRFVLGFALAASLFGLAGGSLLKSALPVRETMAEETKPYDFYDGDWNEATEEGETIISCTGWTPKMLYKEPTTATKITGYIRYNVINDGYDEAPRLLVNIGETEFLGDFGLSNSNPNGSGRVRINGGWDASGKGIGVVSAGQWVKFDFVFKTNSVALFMDDVQLYSVPISLPDPTAPKTYGYCSWNCDVSYKLIETSDYVEPVAPAKENEFFGTMADEVLEANGEAYRLYPSYDFSDAYIPSHTYDVSYKETTVEMDAFVGQYTGDNNMRLWGTYGDAKYGFEFTASRVAILQDGGPVLSEELPPLAVNRVYHIKMEFGYHELVLSLNGEKVLSASPSVLPSSATAVFLWDWNMTSYLRDIAVASRSAEDSAASFVKLFMHMDDYHENAGLCLGKDGYYAKAKAALVDLGEDVINEFVTNEKFADAKARYEAWAHANGDDVYAYTNDFTHLNNMDGFGLIGENGKSTLVIGGIVGLSALAAGLLLASKKKRHN